MTEKLDPYSIAHEREKKSRFGFYTYAGTEKALEKIKERFENSKNYQDNLDFHNTDHTDTIIQRVEDILLTIQRADPSLVNYYDIKIGCLAGAFHDTVQNYDKDIQQDGVFEKVIRKKHIGDNEKNSTKEAVAFMEHVNQKEGREIFTQLDIKTTKEAIEITIPDFDTSHNTVIQPNLNKNSSLIARAVALADIGAAGLDGAEQFLKEGDAVFREENMDIMVALRNHKNITTEQKEYYKERMCTWIQFQEKFAQGRKNLLDKELQGIPSTAKDAVRKLFDKFDRSIQSSREKAKQRKAMPFEQLVKDMGYSY